MSSQPLIPAEGEDAAPEPPQQSGLKRCLKFTGLGVGGCVLIVFTLVWSLQGIMYLWATNLSGCRPGALEGFNYDGDAASNENPAYNLMPRLTLLTERNPRKYVMPFYVFPSNDASTISGGQVGTWWRTWGPIFYTYTYEDMSSKTTIYMRRNLVRLGSSHRIARCDGKEPFVTFTEGGYWLSNRVRHLFGYNQAMTFKIYLGDDLIGVAEEASGEVPSLTFRNTNNDFLGTSVLMDPNFHGTRAHWLVKNNETMPMPYFVANAASLIYAFHTLNVEEAQNDNDNSDANPPSSPTSAFLVPNASSLPLAVAAPAAARERLPGRTRQPLSETEKGLQAEGAAKPEEARESVELEHV